MEEYKSKGISDETRKLIDDSREEEQRRVAQLKGIHNKSTENTDFIGSQGQATRKNPTLGGK